MLGEATDGDVKGFFPKNLECGIKSKQFFWGIVFVPTVCCANRECQSPNNLAAERCLTCNTPLVRRYLWAVGDWIKVYQLEELLFDRYLLVKPYVLLDTMPSLEVEGPEEIPGHIQPYQKLLPFRLNLPEVYDYLPSTDKELDLSVWLLDYGPVPVDEAGYPAHDRLLPSLAETWEQVSPLQQLTWLWQIARLWQPFQRQKVVSSLLEGDWLRVNGSQVQLQQLKLDEPQFYELRFLASAWQPFLTNAHPVIADFCETLYQRLRTGKIPHAEHLLRVLDLAITKLAKQYDFRFDIFAVTDTEPSREHNEDACFPVSETVVTGSQLGNTLAMVCEGVGGQDAGEVASQLVVENLPVRLISKIQKQYNDPDQIRKFIQEMKTDIEAVNDQLSNRNDREKRRERERMGTTLVLSMAHFQQLFLANVGDSRCYWITPTSCQQVTVDDDVASREVRMGLMLHRHAVELPRSGALTQAMGLNNSAQLHPIIQRLIVPSDAVFLLCSDGLCDHGRVEQFWRSEILPVLTGERPVEEATQQLLMLANEKNGHDSVSVILIHCRAEPSVPCFTQAEKKQAEVEKPADPIDELELELDTEIGLKAIPYPNLGAKKEADTDDADPDPTNLPIPAQDPRSSIFPDESNVEEKPLTASLPPPESSPPPLPEPEIPPKIQRANAWDQFQTLTQTTQLLIVGGLLAVFVLLGIVVMNRGNNDNRSAPQSWQRPTRPHV